MAPTAEGPSRMPSIVLGQRGPCLDIQVAVQCGYIIDFLSGPYAQRITSRGRWARGSLELSRRLGISRRGGFCSGYLG
ncbi:hypothetical protein PIB30_004862 [Stylosanthes scabra]|uniref:Uncharacterized protein n=1 Tax=Stylosanthes scabra TaxID=79078 RepID=A0ABU6V5K3_9FABA|nr:hypothetical protein [Stylosanthes scabra]